jgi:hypothetical protein
VVDGPEESVPNGKVGSSLALCPAGKKSVSGGGYGSISGLDASETAAREGWFVLTSNTTGITVKIKAIALCAGSGQAVAANAPSHAAAIRQLNERLTAIKAELAASKR